MTKTPLKPKAKKLAYDYMMDIDLDTLDGLDTQEEYEQFANWLIKEGYIEP